MPHDLYAVIQHALLILSWQENLSSDEVPPQWMWHLDWELEDWFKKVKIERDRKYGDKNKPGGLTDEDDLENNPLFEENIYFERMKRGEPLFE